MSKKIDHEYFMLLAVKAAKKGRGFVKTNPPVGAVIVKNNKIISVGYHLGFGKEHAEVNAIRKAKKNLHGSSIYVTLEPCSTYGKTPPCVNAIIENKIKKVYIGTLDPNPKHNGKAVEILEKHNIEVVVGVLEDKCRKLIKPFTININKQRPYVILKMAMTLDGKIASADNDSKWITNEYSRKKVHKLRSRVDAVAVGKNCVLCDNPELTVRLCKSKKQPDRIVFDSNLEISDNFKVFNQGCEKVFIVCKDKVRSAVPCVPQIKNKTKESKKTTQNHIVYLQNELGLNDVLYHLYNEYNIGTILLEGGSKLATSFIKNKLIDKYMFFYSSKIIGGNGLDCIGNLNIDLMKNSIKLDNVKLKKIKGGDFLVEGYEITNSKS